MYRVDKRIFNINDTILPPETSYQDREGFDSTIETFLAEQKPISKNADRRTGLFIFTELSDAIRFSCRMIDSKIYKVESLHDTISFHKGDMNWTEIMQMLLNNEDAMRQIASHYWTDGCKTFKPCWEVLVNKMRVVSIIIRNDEERNKVCCNFKTTSGLNIEKLNFYIEKLNEI